MSTDDKRSGPPRSDDLSEANSGNLPPSGGALVTLAPVVPTVRASLIASAAREARACRAAGQRDTAELLEAMHDYLTSPSSELAPGPECAECGDDDLGHWWEHEGAKLCEMCAPESVLETTPLGRAHLAFDALQRVQSEINRYLTYDTDLDRLEKRLALWSESAEPHDDAVYLLLESARDAAHAAKKLLEGVASLAIHDPIDHPEQYARRQEPDDDDNDEQVEADRPQAPSAMSAEQRRELEERYSGLRWRTDAVAFPPGTPEEEIQAAMNAPPLEKP